MSGPPDQARPWRVAPAILCLKSGSSLGDHRVSRKNIVIILAAIVILAVAGGGAWYLWGNGGTSGDGGASGEAPVASTNTGPTPAPVLVVIDRAAIMQLSKAGQDIGRQVQQFTAQTKSELDGQVKALENEGNALKREAPGLSADARQKRVAAFEQRQATLQKAIDRKQAQVQAAVGKGRAAMEKVLSPILKDVTKEHGVNLVLDKQAVLFATNSTFDITPEVIEQLNAKLPSVRIDFTAPPQQAPAAK
jgi:Skp family chaperone for outer membrane proteins